VEITLGSRFNVAAFVFEDAEVTAANSCKMADVKPETLKSDIGD